MYKPGWLPKEMGGYQTIPEVDKAVYRKFNTNVTTRLSYYVLFQYIIVLAATALFLFNYVKMSLFFQIITVLGIIFTIVNAGALLENKAWSKMVEIFRLVIITSALGFIIYRYQFDVMLYIPVMLYFLMSTFFIPRTVTKLTT